MKCDETIKLRVKVRKDLKSDEKIHFSLQSDSQIINTGYFDASGTITSKIPITVNLSLKRALPELELITPEASGKDFNCKK